MKIYVIKVVAVLCLFLVACTRVDVCEEASHPHKALVSVNYLCDNAVATDSMVLIAYRPVNDWKCGYMCSPLTAEGRYIFNRPEWLPADSKDFAVRCGELFFFTFSYKKDDFNYRNIEDSKAVTGGNIAVSQKTYSLDKHPKDYAREWDNLNAYAPYVLSSDDIMYQKVGPVGVPLNNYTLDLEPRSIMKDISVDVEIISSGVEIEKVVGELSGVCYNFNFIRGEYDKGNTAKMLFEMSKVAGDTYSAMLSAMSVVPNEKHNIYSGDGILQLQLHTIMPDGGKKVYTARLNLINTLFGIKDNLECIGGSCAIKPEVALKVDKSGISAQKVSSPYVDNWLLSK